MCGIIGYVGHREVLPVLMNGLKSLAYRGYDSAGVALMDQPQVARFKAKGKIDQLEQVLQDTSSQIPSSRVGMGHTRWATHGVPADRNAHPHSDCQGRIACVHNGIIENHAQLREELAREGHVFKSETDTEVIPHLIEESLEKAGSLEEAVRNAVSRLKGSYALVVASAESPEELVAFRQDSPLILGLGEGETFLASDIPALLPYTRAVVVLEDGELVRITSEGAQLTGPDGQLTDLNGRVMEITWDQKMAEKGGYAHFMLKEIHEQPQGLRDTLTGRLQLEGDRPVIDLAEAGLEPDLVKRLDKVAVVACGTACHAGMVARHWMERWARLSTEVDVASEFRYRDPLVDERTLLLVISQSGETADTLAGLREGARLGARSLAVTNVVGSSVSRESDHVIYTWAGPEIAVASTKAYTTQLMVLAVLAVQFGLWRGTLAGEKAANILRELHRLPDVAEAVLSDTDLVESLGRELAPHDHVFFIGRGLDHALALEGQLKLKEISYIHAEAYPAGELKHGTLALIEEGTPVIALVTQDHLREKMLSNIAEVKARGGRIISICQEGDRETEAVSDRTIVLPRVMPEVMPILVALPLQLLSYYAADERGEDIDQPRNLAKSVTVE